MDARSAPRCEASVIRPQQSEPGPAGSPEAALKKFLSVSELALDRQMAATYILGPFRLDAETDTLFRGGDPVPLGHRAVALLRLLVEQRGIPVSKGALMEAAWAGLTVEESNLAVQIAALRRVFAEEPGGEKWIETLPRRGYRFVGPASTPDQGAPTAASRGQPALRRHSMKRTRSSTRRSDATTGPSLTASDNPNDITVTNDFGMIGVIVTGAS